MCIINIVKTGLLLLLISGTVITSGCTDNAQPSTGEKITVMQNSPYKEIDTDYELTFMKDVLNEMKNQGKNITLPLETYRVAKEQARTKDLEGFEESLQLFYEQCNLIMVEVYTISEIKTNI